MKATYVKPVVEILDFCTEEIAAGGDILLSQTETDWDVVE